MKLMKYKEVIAVAKEKIGEMMAPLRAREMRKQGELELIKLETEIAKCDQKIQEITAEYPLNYEKLLDAIDDLDILKRRQKKFNKVIDQLFGSED